MLAVMLGLVTGGRVNPHVAAHVQVAAPDDQGFTGTGGCVQLELERSPQWTGDVVLNSRNVLRVDRIDSP